MKVKKKYSRLINFLSIFDNFKDSDTLVEISNEKYNKLQEFAQSFTNNINEDPESQDPEPQDETDYIFNVSNLPSSLTVTLLPSHDTLLNYRWEIRTYQGYELGTIVEDSITVTYQIINLANDLHEDDETTEVVSYGANDNYVTYDLLDKLKAGDNEVIITFNANNLNVEYSASIEIKAYDIKHKLTSENNFNATLFGEAGDELDFGWYENGTTRLGYPQNTGYNTPIIFDQFYWKNNYNDTTEIINDVECVAVQGWTTRGIGFNDLIIDSNIPVFFGYHMWSDGNWANTNLWVKAELCEEYHSIFGDEQPASIRSIEEYNIEHKNIENWWLTY